MTLIRRSRLSRNAPLLRRAELRSKSRPKSRPTPPEQRVTPEIREQVFARDEYRCLAPVIAAKYDLPTPTPCAGKFGRLAVLYVTVDGPVYDRRALTYEHVREHAAMGGPKPPPSLRWALTLCVHHNVDGWAQANKRHERAYLAELYGGTE